MCTKVYSLNVIEYVWRFALNVVVWSVNLAVQIKVTKVFIYFSIGEKIDITVIVYELASIIFGVSVCGDK